MKSQKKIIIFLSVVTLVIVSIIAGRAFVSSKIEAAITKQKNAPVGVIATKVKYFSFYDQIDTFGTAIANQSFSIRIKKEDLVSSIDFDKYPFVKKNEEIAKLNNEESIIAPFSGRVGKREITPGILGGENSIIANLDDIKFLKVDVKLPENYFSVIKNGLKVTVTTDAYKETFEGAISSVSSRVDPTTRSILVQAKINNSDEKLIPGMLLNIKVIFNEKKSLSIPEEALLIQGKDKFIFKIQNNIIERAKVEIGRRNENKIEIISGLTENEIILAEGTNKVKPKGKVKIVKSVD
ncbi:MAG: efflux RND transporter periplasmic adaptor subunit [Candidatus Pelagibacter sp.]|nr:efflux RND transporter periplasmic adaptor subunit [Candidatus Pelagibacter sp.]